MKAPNIIHPDLIVAGIALLDASQKKRLERKARKVLDPFEYLAYLTRFLVREVGMEEMEKMRRFAGQSLRKQIESPRLQIEGEVHA